MARLLNEGTVDARDILAIIGKTEGNGDVNDFTRELAMRALADLLAPRLGCEPQQVDDRVVMSFSGGTEGVTSPHMLVLSRAGGHQSTPLPEKRLAIATGYTRQWLTVRTTAIIFGILGIFISIGDKVIKGIPISIAAIDFLADAGTELFPGCISPGCRPGPGRSPPRRHLRPGHLQ
ncbi:MAG: ring-opening amidohydrolase [Gammaproteobacteria bacterium]